MFQFLPLFFNESILVQNTVYYPNTSTQAYIETLYKTVPTVDQKKLDTFDMGLWVEMGNAVCVNKQRNNLLYSKISLLGQKQVINLANKYICYNPNR